MKITKTGETGKTFDNVELREPLVGDLLKAERIAGKAEGMGFVAALLSQIGTFDSNKLPPEELEGMRAADFLACLRELGLDQLADSAKDASTSAAKGASA